MIIHYQKTKDALILEAMQDNQLKQSYIASVKIPLSGSKMEIAKPLMKFVLDLVRS